MCALTKKGFSGMRKIPLVIVIVKISRSWKGKKKKKHFYHVFSEVVRLKSIRKIVFFKILDSKVPPKVIYITIIFCCIYALENSGFKCLNSFINPFK